MSKKKLPKLIIEHVDDNSNLNLFSVIEHKQESYLVIVDVVDPTSVGAYVLDYAMQEGVNLELLIKYAENWFSKSNGSYPLSFEFSRLGVTEATKTIYKTFEIPFITRLVGAVYENSLDSPPKIKRRRVIAISPKIEIRPKSSIRSF